ncbi:MAG: hypothetical protein JWR83_2776 [Aeromicrobium sp.]|nr:hypothetical protein [Aeromicrobium sp.]
MIRLESATTLLPLEAENDLLASKAGDFASIASNSGQCSTNASSCVRQLRGSPLRRQLTAVHALPSGHSDPCRLASPRARPGRASSSLPSTPSPARRSTTATRSSRGLERLFARDDPGYSIPRIGFPRETFRFVAPLASSLTGVCFATRARSRSFERTITVPSRSTCVDASSSTAKSRRVP